MKSLFRKFFITVVIFFITFVILEVGLRIGGFAVVTLSVDDRKPSFESNEIRIVALGESTTSIYFAGKREDAWPGQLETTLNKKLPKYKFIIRNVAIPGSNTALQLLALKENIATFKPDLAISMMGVNDSGVITLDESFLSKLKVTKLFHEFKRQRNINKSQAFHSCPVLPRLSTKEAKEVVEIVRNSDKPIEDILKRFADFGAQMKPGLLTAVGLIIWMGRLDEGVQPLNSISDLPKINQFFEAAYQEMPDCALTLQNVAYMMPRFNQGEECQRRIARVFDNGIVLTDTLLQTLNICSVSKILPETKKILSEYNLESLLTNATEATFRNYRRMAELAEQNNFLYVVLPYPRTRTEIYKQAFLEPSVVASYPSFTALLRSESDLPDEPIRPEFSSVLFLENSSNFESALKSSAVGEIFTDLFGIRFGHMTVLGNSVLAAGVAEQLINNPAFQELLKKK